ncbi:hypothetical protein JCM9492_10610 [Aquifex pyrophilus]
MNPYKEKLLKCQKLLSENKYEELLKEIEELSKMNPEGMTKEEAQESLRILDFLISEVEKRREELFNRMMNYQRFKNYLR